LKLIKKYKGAAQVQDAYKRHKTEEEKRSKKITKARKMKAIQGSCPLVKDIKEKSF
jgi:hypothetical protein